MRPKTQSTAEQEAIIAKARKVLEADEWVAACWLEGSFAEGTADAWSDIDMHVAIYDEHFDGFFVERLELLSRIRPVLAYGESALPRGAHLVYATLSGPVRFDLYLERLSQPEAVVRWEEPKLLFDRAGIGQRLKATGDPNVLLKPWLEDLLRSFFAGAMWPVRLWGRGEFGNLLYNAVTVVYQFLVPAMLAQDDPRNYYRGAWHNEHRLRPERRRQLNALLAEIIAAFRGTDDGSLDYGALVRLHEEVIAAIWRELRAACAKFGVAYPETAEREIREYYARELGMEVPPTS